MPFRAAFDCLWCGAAWQTRSGDDLEGWAQLCPSCIGKADGNGFLSFRLRTGLAERSRAAKGEAEGSPPPPHPATDPAGLDAGIRDWFAALGAGWDDRYVRGGRFSRGPVRDLAWQLELDAVTTWLDRQPLRGEIVELAAGTGWWSTLLAGKGSLSLYDANEGVLEAARRRLVAHGLRAHLHVRDAWAEPDRAVDSLFVGHWLSLVPDDRLGTWLRLAGRGLGPGGTFAFIDRAGDPEAEAVDDPIPVGGMVRRLLPDGRAVPVPQVARSVEEVSAALVAAGFGSVEVSSTGRFFVMGSARR